MLINERNGSVTLIDDASPARTLSIAAGDPQKASKVAAFFAASAPPPPPDNPTLGDWRVALALWGRLAEVTSKVQAMVTAGNPLGVVAQQRLEYSNNVLRTDLMTLRGAFGFSEADVDESLWRASRVAAGDLSGRWPPA